MHWSSLAACAAATLRLGSAPLLAIYVVGKSKRRP
jgi:hypothetical protein